MSNVNLLLNVELFSVWIAFEIEIISLQIHMQIIILTFINNDRLSPHSFGESTNGSFKMNKDGIECEEEKLVRKDSYKSE